MSFSQYRSLKANKKRSLLRQNISFNCMLVISNHQLKNKQTVENNGKITDYKKTLEIINTSKINRFVS